MTTNPSYEGPHQYLQGISYAGVAEEYIIRIAAPHHLVDECIGTFRDALEAAINNNDAPNTLEDYIRLAVFALWEWYI